MEDARGPRAGRRAPPAAGPVRSDARGGPPRRVAGRPPAHLRRRRLPHAAQLAKASARADRAHQRRRRAGVRGALRDRERPRLEPLASRDAARSDPRRARSAGPRARGRLRDRPGDADAWSHHVGAPGRRRRAALAPFRAARHGRRARDPRARSRVHPARPRRAPVGLQPAQGAQRGRDLPARVGTHAGPSAPRGSRGDHEPVLRPASGGVQPLRAEPDQPGARAPLRTAGGGLSRGRGARVVSDRRALGRGLGQGSRAAV